MGGLAGITGTAIIFPLDTVKTHLMNQKALPSGAFPYSGPLDAARKIMAARGGVHGLYHGLRANLIGVTPEKAIKLGVNDYFREYFRDRNLARGVTGNAGDGITLSQAIFSGSAAGMAQVIATNPMEIVKIRLQLAQSAATNAGGAQVKAGLVDVVRHLGLRGLYRGSSATLLRDIPFSAIFFPTYGILKKALHRHGFFGALVAGSISGGVSAGLCTPMDVIKTRLQAQGGSTAYSGIVDCATQIYTKEGVGAFFKGWLPRSLVVAPLFGVALIAFEAMKQYMMRSRARAQH